MWRGKAHFGYVIHGSVNKDGSANGHVTTENSPMAATFTIGAEATNVINVGIQLMNAMGRDLTSKASIRAYLSTDATGDAIKAADANLGSAIGTDGILAEDQTDAWLTLVSEDDGDIDIDFTKTDTGTFYLNLVMPSGEVVTSGAITFA